MPTCIIITTWTLKPPDWGRPAALSPALLQSEVEVGADLNISPSHTFIVFHHTIKFQPSAFEIEVKRPCFITFIGL